MLVYLGFFFAEAVDDLSATGSFDLHERFLGLAGRLLGSGGDESAAADDGDDQASFA
ncbi:hypothetical protein M1L60_14535 [Actinoplanes sp. TRM 88003]|uniref:Uncharacterized protein n=1 Tax=Paractinoplanes aksuensis TaxID=2939490 RepID=A0ABT1DLU9_9ACTN|nr:hypothetical protein [Actinoplanes aksuensis]MCO8271812.1 hypothetical protein [Actinoplanes aksuensis]